MTTLTLPQDLTSPEHLSAVSMELTTHLGSLRDAAVRAKSKHTDAEQPELPALLADMLRANNVDQNDTTALETLRTALDDLLAKAPVIHLTLAAVPSRAIKRQITLWFRTEINPLVLLTFAARADIGGGVVCQAGSHIYDYSFRRHILDNKQKIAELAFGV